MSQTVCLRRPDALEARAGNGLPVLATIATGTFMALLDTTVVNVALPSMQASLHADVAALTWIVDAYTLTFAGLMLSAGILSDRLGARRVFMTGLSVFIVASALCGVAPSAPLLIVARLLQGAGAALFIPSTLAILRHTYPDPLARARAIGVYGGLVASASAAGPVVGGMLIGHLGWRAAFLINIPIGVAGLVGAVLLIGRIPKRAGRRMDLPGQILGALALVALSFALIEAPEAGWLSARILVAFALAVVACIAFFAVEARGVAPMVPLSLFHDRRFSAATVAGLVMNLAYFGALFVLSLYLQRGLGLAPFATGLAMLPLAVLLAAGNVVAGRLMARLGAGRQMTLGLGVAAAGFLLFAASPSIGGLPLLFGAMVIAGGGTALAVPPMTSMVLESAPSELAGVASAVLNATRQVGSLLGIALAGALVASTARIGIATMAVMGLAALAYTAGAVVTARLR